ncbi:hypothetical protein [Dactylosporangium sp. CA-139066]|uniref:hypothetical protein n=1 Tax=Dactylosporangium sp. CA-139066 TaxID=3239930 RepID=UPI003D8A0DB5
MGHRANYVVIERGETSIGWSRWGGQRIVADLLGGPEAAAEALRPSEPPPPNTVEALQWRGVVRDDELMSDVYCEGAAVIDHDRRVLLAFERPDDYGTFVDGLAGLVEAWPGWRVRWAFDGILDVAEYLGLDAGPLRREVPDPAKLPDVSALFRGPGRLADWPDDPEEGALSIRRPDGSLELYLAGYDPTAIAYTTAEQVASLGPGFAGLERTQLPRWGVHLDPAARAAALWCIDRLEGALRDRSVHWPGWTWTLWGGDIRRQLDACGGALRVPPLPSRLRHMKAVGVETIAVI